MTHILLVLTSGLLFHNLSIGLYVGIAIAIVVNLIRLVKHRAEFSLQSACLYIEDLLKNGLLLFSVLYLFCFFSNRKKPFMNWDEFSHWGMFLKESLRLDRLYCESPLSFAHKDYVPAVTLFETIWCRLSGTFREADAYRGIQIFMFSMILPVFENVRGRKHRFFSILLMCLLPLIFNTSNAFMFYHSIYCDYVVGVIFFFCAFWAWQRDDGSAYHVVVMTIALSVMVLTKMTAPAWLPMILLIYVMKIPGRRHVTVPWRKRCLSAVPLIAVPTALWFWFNRFVDAYVPNTGSVQSYDGMRPSALLEIFGDPAKSTIPFLAEVRRAYTTAVFSTNVLIHGSFAVVLGLIVIAFILMPGILTDDENAVALQASDEQSAFCGKRTDCRRIAVWVLFSGTVYALMMYFLYTTAFGRYEATVLASYERYMNSFLVMPVMLLPAVFLDSEPSTEQIHRFHLAVSGLAVVLLVFHIGVFHQVLPGNLINRVEVEHYLRLAEGIENHTEEDARIYMVGPGDSGWRMIHYAYYCSPRRFGSEYFWPDPDEIDDNSRGQYVREFLDKVADYDYLFCTDVNPAFYEIYSEAFEKPELLLDDSGDLLDGAVFRITDTNPLVRMEQVN